jgi:hypothetical protein
VAEVGPVVGRPAAPPRRGSWLYPFRLDRGRPPGVASVRLGEVPTRLALTACATPSHETKLALLLRQGAFVHGGAVASVELFRERGKVLRVSPSRGWFCSAEPGLIEALAAIQPEPSAAYLIDADRTIGHPGFSQDGPKPKGRPPKPTTLGEPRSV